MSARDITLAISTAYRYFRRAALVSPMLIGQVAARFCVERIRELTSNRFVCDIRSRGVRRHRRRRYHPPM